MCLLGLEYLIFTFLPIFSPKIVKIKPIMGNFKPKCWNMKYKIFSEITQLNAVKISHKVGNIKCHFLMQYDEVITNPRWWTAAILKITLTLYFSCELSDFDQIWYADANFQSENGLMWKKIEILQIQDSGWMPYWTSFFGYISVPYWLINAKFGSKMKNQMPI